MGQATYLPAVFTLLQGILVKWSTESAPRPPQASPPSTAQPQKPPQIPPSPSGWRWLPCNHLAPPAIEAPGQFTRSVSSKLLPRLGHQKEHKNSSSSSSHILQRQYRYLSSAAHLHPDAALSLERLTARRLHPPAGHTTPLPLRLVRHRVAAVIAAPTHPLRADSVALRLRRPSPPKHHPTAGRPDHPSMGPYVSTLSFGN